MKTDVIRIPKNLKQELDAVAKANKGKASRLLEGLVKEGMKSEEYQNLRTKAAPFIKQLTFEESESPLLKGEPIP